MRVLLIEDTPRLAEAVAEILRKSGYGADVAHIGDDGLAMALTGAYDVLLLDIMLPDMSGMDVLRKLREAGSVVPVILLTARQGVGDRVAGLDAGADDYLPKPFHASELLARIRAVTRRPATYRPNNAIEACGLVLDAEKLSVQARGGAVAVELTPKEALLLEAFMGRSGSPVSKSDLAVRLWGPHVSLADNRIEVLVHALRGKRDCGQKVGHLRGVRTEVRMYDRDTVELLLLALDEGMGVTRAAREVGVSLDTARRWAAGMLPRSCAAAPRASGRIGADEARTTRGGARVKKIEIGALYEPPETGPLAEMTPDQIEKLLLRAVLDDLKGGGSHPLSTPMRSRCELGERLRLATGLPTSTITRFLEIPRSTWYYHRSRPARAGRGEALRPLVGAAFEECGRRGYRAVHAQLRRGGVRVSEKVVRRLMREMGLTARRGRRRRWSSYAGETSPAPPNLPLRADGTHDFRAAAPNELWVTDITEFRLPSGARCYLSPVIDCFDGRPVAWSIGARPTAGLANSSLEAACATLAPGEAPAVHTDRGCHYRWPGWVAICEANGLARSMSRKGMSCDNARAEGLFGLLKQEFYYARDWRGAALGEFMGALDSWMRWFRSGRISQGLGWMTPDEYRASLRRPV